MERVGSPVSVTDSPCVRRCCLDNDDICLGCFRTLNEITSWSESSQLQRQEILKQAAERKRQHDDKYRIATKGFTIEDSPNSDGFKSAPI